MKTFTLFFICMLTVNIIDAQPVILYENMAEPGFTSPASIGPEVPVGSPGADQIWDFSDLTLTPVAIWTIEDPVSTPYFSVFPSSNFSYEIEVFGESSYDYLSLQPSIMESLGEGWDENGGRSYLPNPKTVLIYPFNYQDVIIDDWARTDGVTGTVIRTYDAYGTLITPFGTFLNVARVTTTGSAINTVFYNMDPVFAILQVDHEEGMTVAMVDGMTGLDEPETTTLKLYPNPVTDQLHIQSTMEISMIEVMNLTGQRLLIYVEGGSSIIDMSSMQSGIYLIRITDNRDGIINKMVLKQ